jgi:hypothetical protein
MMFRSLAILFLLHSSVVSSDLSEIWLKKQRELASFEAKGDFSILQIPLDGNGQKFHVTGRFHWISSNEKFFADIRSTNMDVNKEVLSTLPYRVTFVGDGLTVSCCRFNKNHSKGCEVEVFKVGGSNYREFISYLWFDLHDGLKIYFPEIVTSRFVTKGEKYVTDQKIPYSNGEIEGVFSLNADSLLTTFETRPKSGEARQLITFGYSENGTPKSYLDETFLGDKKIREQTLTFKQLDRKQSDLQFGFHLLDSCEGSRVVEHDESGKLFISIPNSVRGKDLSVSSAIAPYRSAAVELRNQKQVAVRPHLKLGWVMAGIGCVIFGVVLYFWRSK